MMKALILICAASLPRADCSIDTALDVIQGPETGSPAHCGFIGQGYIASTAMAGALDGEHYLKVVCTAGQRRDIAPVRVDHVQDPPEADDLVQQADGQRPSAIE